MFSLSILDSFLWKSRLLFVRAGFFSAPIRWSISRWSQAIHWSMTSRHWPFVSSDCRIDPATITHKESIHWIHTTGRMRRRRRYDWTTAESQTSIHQTWILWRASDFPVDRHPLPGQHPRWASIALLRTCYFTTSHSMISPISTRRVIRSTRFRESAGSCPQIFSVIDPQLASNCVKCVREMR